MITDFSFKDLKISHLKINLHGVTMTKFYQFVQLMVLGINIHNQ